MKYYILTIFIYLTTYVSHAQFTVSGGNGQPFEYTSGLAGTGIEKVYLLNTFTGAQITYTTTSSAVVTLHSYTRSLTDKQQITSSDITTSHSGNNTTYTVSNLQDGKGYIAEVNGSTSGVIWIIDYSKHLPQLNSITVSEAEDKCSIIKLLVNKSDALPFYAPSGRVMSINRLYDLEYETLDTSNKDFNLISEKLESIIVGTELTVDAPFKDTEFKLSGDHIAKHFGLSKQISSSLYQTSAVKGFIETEYSSENENSDENTTGGMSAPVTANFKGYANAPVAHYYTWFIYNTQDPDNVVARYTGENMTYTFSASGTYKIELEVANRNSECPYTTSVELQMAESKLEIPNYFSPGTVEGITKEFKVYHKSLLKFKASIYNRWGNEIYTWTDPDKGWDGKYKGKYVGSGVYFYVIVAEGSDGHKYKKSGDINILRSR